MSTNEGTPALDSGETVWCEGCRKLKKEVTRLQEEHAINYQTLKQKIISTDLLIRKYRTKCEEYDLQNKHMEEQSRRLERTQLDCEMLETQLKASLQSTEPLRKAQVDLEAKLKVKDTEIQNLKNSLEGAEMIQKQYEALIADNNLYANEEERKQIDKKIQNLESSNQRYVNNLKSTKEELKTVKSEISRSSKNYKLLETKHKRILIKLDKYWNLLKENDLLPAGDRQPPRTNYNSGSEEQDEAEYYSDDMEDENKNYSAPSPAHDLDLDLDNDLEDVESELVSTTKKQQELKKEIIDIKKQPEPKVKPKKKGRNSKKTKGASSENTEDTEETTADEHIRENDLGDTCPAHKHKKEDNICIRRGSQSEADDNDKSDPESCSDFGDDFVNGGLSAMKYFFTFSPISAPVSPLPPSPAPGRAVRSSANRPSNLEDTDDSMDTMAASLQSRLHDNASRSLRRSPRLKEKTDSSIFSSEDEQESSSKRTPKMKGCKKPDIKPSPKLQNKLNFTGEGDREHDTVEDEISVASGSVAVVHTDDQELKEDMKKDGKVRGTFDRKGSLPFVVQHLFKEVGRSDSNAESAGSQNESEMENGADIDMESDTSVDTVKANDDISNHSPKKSKSFSPNPCDSKEKDLTSEASPSRMTRSMSQPESTLAEPKVQSPRPKSAMARQTFLTPPPPRTKRLRAVSPKVGEEEGKETRRKRTISLPSDLSDLEPMRRSPRLRTLEKEDSSPLKETSRSSSEENLKGKVEKLDDTKKQEKIFEKTQDKLTETSPVRMLRSRSIEPTTLSPKVSDNDEDKITSPKSPTRKIRKTVPSDQAKIEAVKFVPNDQKAFLDKTTKANLPKRKSDCLSKNPENVSGKLEQPMRRTRSRPILSSADSSESDIFVEKEKSPKSKIQSPPFRKSAETASKSDIVSSSISEYENIKVKGLNVDAALQLSGSESNSNSTQTLRSKKAQIKSKQTLPKSQSSSDSESSSESDLESTKRGCSKIRSPRKRIISSSESDNEVPGTKVVSSCHPCSSESEEEKTKSLPRTRTRSSTSLVQSSDSEKQEMLQSQKRKPVRKSEPSARRTVRKKNNESVKPDVPKEFKSKEFISTESDSDDEDEHVLDKTQNNNVEQKHQNPDPEYCRQTGNGPRAPPTYERSRVQRGRGKKTGRGKQAIPPGKLHPLRASTYPSLKDSFRKVETIQDGKASRARDDDHLSKDSDEATSQNLLETKTKNSNSTDQDDTGINTSKATKETESESDRSSGPGFFPLYNKRARQLRHRYKPIVSDKDFADIILERRRITRSVSDGSSSEAKKSEVEEKDKINERNVNISKRTEKFVERLKHSAERMKSENLLVKENKKVFSTLPKQAIIAPTRRNLRGHVSSSSEVEVMNRETSNDISTKTNVKEMSQSNVSCGLVKNQNVLDEVDSDAVKSDIPENDIAVMPQDSSLKTDNSVISPLKKVETDKPNSDVTEDKSLTAVKEKTAGQPHSSSANGQTCSVFDDQSVSPAAEPEVENSGLSISQSGSTMQESTAEDLPLNSTKDDNCLVSREGSTEMETSETKTKDKLKVTHGEHERKDSVLENKVKDKEFKHVSSTSEMEGINSESDVQYTESDIQTSDMDTIQVFVYQDASQTSASESVVESPVKSVSPKQCVKSDKVDKNDAWTSESVREGPKSPSENIEVGKVPECRTKTVPGGHTSAFKSVVASPKSVKLKSTHLDVDNSSVGQGEAQTAQVTRDPAQSKLIPSLVSISESVRESQEALKPVEQCPAAPSITVGNTLCDEDDQSVEEETNKGPAKVVDASVDSYKSKKDVFYHISASQTPKEETSTLGLLKDESFTSDKRTENIEMNKSEEKNPPRRKSSRHLSRNSAISDDYQLVETTSTQVGDNCRTPKKTEKDNKMLESQDDSDIKQQENPSKRDQVKTKSLDEGISVDVANDNRKGSFNGENEGDDSETTGDLHTVVPKAGDNLWKGKTRRRMKNSGESESDNNSPRNDNQRRKRISKSSAVGSPSRESEADGSDSADGRAKILHSSSGKNKKDESKDGSEEVCLSQENHDSIKESLPDLETQVNDSQGCPKVLCDSKEKKDLSEDDLVVYDVDTTHEGEAEDDDLDSVDISLNSAPETRQKPKKRVTIKRQMSFDQDEAKAGEYTTSEKKSKTDLKKKRKNLKKSSKHKEEDGINVQGSNDSVDQDISLKQTTELVTGEECCREGTTEITGVEEQELDLDLDEDSDDSAKKKKVETQCSFGFSVNASTSEAPQEGFSLLDSLNLIPELEEGEEEEIESKSLLSDLGSLDPDRAVSPEIVSITQKSCFISISALIRDELRSTASTSSPLPPSPMNFFQITAPVSPLPSSPAPSRSQKVKKPKRKTKSKKQLENLSTLVNDPHNLKTQTGKLKNSGKPLETQTSESTAMTPLEPKSSTKKMGSSETTLHERKDSEVQLATEMPSILHLDEAISSMSGSQRRIARVAKKETDLPTFGASPATTTLKPKPVYSRTTSGEVPSASTSATSMSLAKQQLTKRQQNQEAKELRGRKRKSSESEILPVKKQVLTPPKTAGNSQSEVGEMLTQYLHDPQEGTADTVVEKWLNEHEKTQLVTEIFRESVKVLQACRDDQRPLVERTRSEERGDNEEVVMMTETEIRLLDLLTCLLHKYEEESPRHQLMELLWNAIFLSCTPCLGRLSLCRMFTALCRHGGDIEQVRVFVYKLLSCGYLSFVQPVLAVVGVWPLSLSPGPDPSAMSLVIRHIVLNSCQSQSAPPDVKTLGPVFQEICGWSPLNETPGQLLSRIIEKLKLAVTADSTGAQFETMKSIELLLWSHGWRFIYMSFVNYHLTSMCDAWKAKGDNSNINPKYAVTLIRIFGNIYQLPRFTQKHKEFSKALKRCLIPILDIPTKHSELPMSCAEVLAELSPLHPHFVMDVLSQWFKKHRSEVPASVRNKLEQTRHFIATKISPFNVDSFV